MERMIDEEAEARFRTPKWRCADASSSCSAGFGGIRRRSSSRIKKAEDDAALNFRYDEFEGKQSQVRLQLPEKAIRAAETNLMEKEAPPLSLRADGRALTVPTDPDEIKTVKVWLAQLVRSQAVAARQALTP